MAELITIVTPTGRRATKELQLAPRKYASLNHRCIGLLDNNKPNADRFLECVAELLKQRHEGVKLLAKRKMTRTGADGIEEFAGQCDVVVNAFAD